MPLVMDATTYFGKVNDVVRPVMGYTYDLTIPLSVYTPDLHYPVWSLPATWAVESGIEEWNF